MTRYGLAPLILAIAVLGFPLVAQEPSDLQVQLRSATGSNRFQVGQIIPLEALFSSSTPNRYLEPCTLFREASFGFPQCRFFTRWAFTIAPEEGWVDLRKEFPVQGSAGGPAIPAPNRDLSSQPETISYVLTHRFRFDKPGKYRVRLEMDIGLDDETTQRRPAPDSAIKPHSVSVVREIVLEIVPASAEWQQEIIRNGYDAYWKPVDRNSDPPSPEFLRYQQATEALCDLGTPEAARVLAGLLSTGHPEVHGCLAHTPSAEAASEEMQRLLVNPHVAVDPAFFSVLVKLLARVDPQTKGLLVLSQPYADVVQQYVDREREILFSVLPKKEQGQAQIASLATVLQNPSRTKPTDFEESYDLPFAPPVIAAFGANFDHMSSELQELLLGDAWGRVRSPLSLALVRRLAEKGNGQALLRWLELDPATAAEFTRKEVVRPVPQFSSFYLRSPESSLPGQEAQLAANFVALTQDQDLVRAATLLHRYATRSVLPVVLPFIDANLSQWPCSIQFPVLAYLLKTSPADAAPRVDHALKDVDNVPCARRGTFFTDLGFLEPSPILERLAMAQINSGTNLVRDAVDYLERYSSGDAKQFLWEELVRHEQLVSRGAEKQGTLVYDLAGAFEGAQAWVLTEEESNQLQALLGKQTARQLSCWFSCGASFGTSPKPADYAIYAHPNLSYEQRESPMEYLNPTEQLRYSINQYHCADMRALKEKIMQLPAGSSFDLANGFTAGDRDILVEISDFLWSHDYKVRNPQNRSFLRPDSP